jgi:hypothetical protein
MTGSEKLEIMVVEDNPLHQRTIADLQEEGHTVTLAEDFVSAVGLLGISSSGERKNDRRSFDALLTDLMIPYGNGFEFVGLSMEYRDTKEHPLGFPLLLAGMRLGIPYIGLYTDRNRHQGPEAASLSLFRSDFPSNEHSMPERMRFSGAFSTYTIEKPGIIDCTPTWYTSRVVLTGIAPGLGMGKYLLKDGTLTSKIEWNQRDQATEVKDWKSLLAYIRE